MLLKLNSLKNPRARIEKGEAITYPFWKTDKGETPVKFIVSGLSCDAYQKAIEQLGKDLALEYKDKPVPPDVAHQRYGELLSEHILHGWEGLDEPYSPELADIVLTDRDHEKINNAVVWCARKVDQGNDPEFIEDVIKNSEEPSATN